MREIKFRAWDRDQEEIQNDWEKDLTLIEHFGFDGGDKFILMQYTGLKDKNGKEIYEGDIVKDEDMEWIVEYRISTLSYDLRQRDKDTYDCPLSYIGNLDLLEVIGNIHEDIANKSKGEIE